MLSAFRLKGRLDVAALERSLNEISRRHEVLRTTFTLVDGHLVQVIAHDAILQLPVRDLCNVPHSEREEEAKRITAEEGRKPFDLGKGPLVRAMLLRISDEDHVFLYIMHHIVSDGWSRGIFYSELSTLYEAFFGGKSSPLRELPIQYADFSVWQRQWLQGEVLEKQLSYWKQQLADVPVLELPTDRPRPPVQTYRGARQSLVLPKTLCDDLKAVSRHEGVTLFMTLLAAFQTLLYRYTGQEDIVVGSPIAGRNRTEIEGLIGFFVNTLVMRTSLSGDPSFRELLGRVRKIALEAYTHQDLPFEKLVEELQPERDLSRTPLFQVFFNMVGVEAHELSLHGLTVEQLILFEPESKFDFTLYVREKDQEIHFELVYNTGLFHPDSASRMLGHFQALLQSIAANPEQRLSDLPILTEAERQQLLVKWNDTKRDYPKDKCIHELFEAQVERTPDAVAVIFEDKQLTYRELNQRANQLAHYLQKLGVGTEVRVAIYVERSLEMVVSLLGVLKAGGAYVPLDPEYPKARLAYMLAQTEVDFLLTRERFMESLPEFKGNVVCLDRDCGLFEREGEGNPDTTLEPDNLAYVIYTSGSTGKPKGVLSCHRGVVNYFSYLRQTYDLNNADTVLQLPSLSFDASVRDLIGPLTVGAQVVITNDLDAKEPAALLSKIRERSVTCLLSLVPTMLNGLLEAGRSSPLLYDSVRLILVSGEALTIASCQKAKAVFGHRTWIVNQYGPTETTMTCSYHRVLEADNNRRIAPLGRSIPNARMYILDSHLNLVLTGIRGELHIGGVGLVRGYAKSTDLTAERFIPNPFSDEPGARLYKTGDLARYLPDGNIEFLGRLDHQVKIRGFRIELGEIEAVLGQHPAVRHAVAVAREDLPGDNRLVAYIVPNTEQAPTTSDLRNFLKTKLPEYMLPSAFVLLDAFPLTPNRKVDRRALPAPDHGRPDLKEAFVAPRTAVEELLAGIWAEVLGLERVGVHDNFFDLGGHSLLATQIMSRTRGAFRLDLPLRSLFEKPTINEFAAVLAEEGGDGTAEEDLARVLGELESLSDEEAERLLTGEGPSGEKAE
jgi:amino acid adenylation domain-containing protein